MAERKPRFLTDSGIPLPAFLSDGHAPCEPPGEPPYTRGVHPTMYRTRLWTMRQYAGFGTVEETNARYRFLLSEGVTGLSVAFDLPTQIGYDSDHTLAAGEVGKVGVAIDTLADMERLFQGIPLQDVTTSMTINATAAILLALYVAVAKRQGADLRRLGGTVQNDILKEYAARGTYIYPPRPSMRLVTDVFRWCAAELPAWNTISISGYHMREAGATAVQEVAFTLANGIAYTEAAIAAGMDVDAFAGRLSFFFNIHNQLFEEVAKLRAARRLWATIMRERFHAQHPDSMKLRFHAQTAGSTLTAQQPENNIVRTTIQALAAALGGTQSLHCNGYDEALALPTERAARIALRTQQILAHESGVADSVDPLAGSYLVEYLTDEIALRASAYLDRIEAMGGSVAAIERGFIQDEIARSAYEAQKGIESKERIVVGVNAFITNDEEPREVLRIDDSVRARQIERLSSVKRARDMASVEASLRRLGAGAKGNENLMPSILAATEAHATLGEISDTLRAAWGEYTPGA